MRQQGYASCERRLTDASGRHLPGHLELMPARAKGVVILVHDFFGLTPHVRGLAGRLVAEGFVAFAADFYRGQVATTRDEAAALAQAIAPTWKSIAVELGLGVAALLTQHPGSKAAVVGFGMGGAAALVGAAAIERLSAAVTFYGIPQDVTIENQGVRIQCHFAAHDPKCTPERVADLQRSLRDGQIRHDVHQYEAQSGFFNTGRGDAYSASDAELAWTRMLGFLNSALG
jgi:carboxymethylenebutenolidase